MKRGKDEEKIVGPMFPRLHVNDTEKGGPRAPPRNKMALYEQLSIPSQRFNPGVLPPNPNNTTNMVHPPASSSQASGHETGMFVQVQLPPSIHPTENRHTRYSDLNTPLVQLERKKKLEEDDFRVPIFVRSEMGQDHSKIHNIMNKERISPFIPAYSGRLPNLQNASVEEPKQTDTTGLNSRQEARRQNEENSNEPIRGIDYRNSSIPMRDLQQEEQRSPNDTNGDDVSETSMVDSISAIDISPDDVVGIIGQKHFWKARRAIVNQQRVFAVQVFELHRLMKVQRLIAASPHILLEDDAYLGKTSKAPPAKKLPLEYIVKPTPTISKQKVVPEKPNHTIECSAENAIGKASLSSVQNGSPFSGNPTDSKMGSWGFNQPTGHQWLIPVMSPSEGLVYKPYPGPGFMGAVCGPPVSTPVMGNFLNYGISPFAPPPSHGYFPPYGMPVMNPPISGSTGEQINHFTGQGLHDHLSGGGANFNVPYKSVSDVVKLRSSKESELQVSTASSPSGRQGGPHVNPTADGRNALPLFPTSPAVQVHEPRDSGQATRVIKVVPHNARSATESVARIFRSIQEERKQNDSA